MEIFLENARAELPQHFSRFPGTRQLHLEESAACVAQSTNFLASSCGADSARVAAASIVRLRSADFLAWIGGEGSQPN